MSAAVVTAQTTDIVAADVGRRAQRGPGPTARRWRLPRRYRCPPRGDSRTRRPCGAPGGHGVHRRRRCGGVEDQCLTAVRQKRLARELWAIADGQSWVFPLPQFETDDNGGPIRVIRGLEQVFKALPEDLHPVAVEGFLCTPQAGLFVDRPLTPVEWLRDGGDIDQVVSAAVDADWYGR